MGFPWLQSITKRLLPNRRRRVDFDVLVDVDDDAESWRGTMATSGTEDWQRIQEGQRMLQLSTTLWFGTDCGAFDMKDHERYEMLYGRPIGVEDPMLLALRMQALQIRGGIYVEPRQHTRESHGYSCYSMDGTDRGTENGDAQRSHHDNALAETIRRYSNAPPRESTNGDPVDTETRRFMNDVKLQRKLEPSMSWHFRVTRFDPNKAEASASGEIERCSSPPDIQGRLTPPVNPTDQPIPEGSSSQRSSQMYTSSAATSAMPGDTADQGAHCSGESHQTGEKGLQDHGILSPGTSRALEDERTEDELEEERLRHVAWRWRFTKRWCKEHTEPLAEPSRRDAAFTEALAGAPSGAWEHLLRQSADGGHDEADTFTESMLFSDIGEDVSARGQRTSQPGTTSAAAGHTSGTGERGGWREGRIRGGAMW